MYGEKTIHYLTNIENNWEESSKEPPSSGENQNTKAQIALIIDNFNTEQVGAQELMKLPIPLSFSIMPFSPDALKQDQFAHDKGYEVLIHFPMEPHQGKREWLGENPILNDLSNEQVKDIFELALKNVPHAIGFNNYMGSKVTENKEIMGTLIDLAQQHQFLVVDNKTSSSSVIPELCIEKKVPFLERSVLLDNEPDRESIQKQLEKLVQLSLEKGYAVGIGHLNAKEPSHIPQVLQEMLPYFSEKNIEIVSLSRLKELYLTKLPRN